MRPCTGATVSLAAVVRMVQVSTASPGRQVGERCRHAVDDAAVVLPVAAGDDRGALGQLVLAALPLQAELVERGLHHRHAGGQLFKIEEPQRGAGGGRQEPVAQQD